MYISRSFFGSTVGIYYAHSPMHDTTNSSVSSIFFYLFPHPPVHRRPPVRTSTQVVRPAFSISIDKIHTEKMQNQAPQHIIGKGPLGTIPLAPETEILDDLTARLLAAFDIF